MAPVRAPKRIKKRVGNSDNGKMNTRALIEKCYMAIVLANEKQIGCRSSRREKGPNQNHR